MGKDKFSTCLSLDILGSVSCCFTELFNEYAFVYNDGESVLCTDVWYDGEMAQEIFLTD